MNRRITYQIHPINPNHPNHPNHPKQSRSFIPSKPNISTITLHHSVLPKGLPKVAEEVHQPRPVTKVGIGPKGAARLLEINTHTIWVYNKLQSFLDGNDDK
jgi:hypothetical protein